jgi:hypothetical protein
LVEGHLLVDEAVCPKDVFSAKMDGKNLLTLLSTVIEVVSKIELRINVLERLASNLANEMGHTNRKLRKLHGKTPFEERWV